MQNATPENAVIHLKNALLSLDNELSDRLKKLQIDITQSHNADSEEQAIERENDEVIEQLIDDTNMELSQVKHALDRIESGDYYRCEKCGNEIGLERLQAIPYATLCMQCA